MNEKKKKGKIYNIYKYIFKLNIEKYNHKYIYI